MIGIKNIANSITFSRIICAIFLVFTVAFSKMFWMLYLYGGLSDLLDGSIARSLNQQSDFGGRLDSIADFIFLISIVIAVAPNIAIPLWICGGIGGIALIRMLSYVIGYKKYHTFSSLHTYANKVTGAFLFATPVLYIISGITITGIILSLLAFASALEELLIIVKCKELDRNIKSIFIH